MSKVYTALFQIDESGAWIVSVPSVRGCHTYGRSLAEARRRIREALTLWVKDADKAELKEEVRLPARARQALTRTLAVRARAEAEGQRAQGATKEAARMLTNELKLGVRDAGELLGVSFQRVQQLLADESRAS